MSIQVNIFNSGSVPTATELANFINELNTDLDSIVTLNTEQIIEGAKTFWGSKMLKFKQKTTADKLGFTFYDNQGKEVGNFEYDNKNNFRLLALGNYFSATNQEIEGHVGFKVFNKSASSAYRLICPLAGNAKNSIPTLSETYTNFYMPLVFTNGAVSVTADNGGKVDLSTLIGSGSGDGSGLATVATTGDYNDLLNLPTLFRGNYNDLTNKPALFSGDYADLTNKPTIPTNLSDLSDDSTHRLVTDALISTWNSKSDFSGSYNDLTNKPTIPNAQVNSDWNSSSGVSQILNKPNLATVATSGSYNDLSGKPIIPTVPVISTNITSDATSDTKTASPKAVKDFVEGKGYLTQHQDISGKADQTDLEALEDRVETLEQGGSGSTDEDKCVKLVKDPANYLKANVGDIIKYNGTSTSDFIHGHDYECTKKGNAAYSVSSGDYVLDVAESATNEEFIAAMANEVKPFKYSESVSWSSYIEYCATTNPNVILGLSTKTKSNLVVGDVLVSAPYMTPVSVVTYIEGSTVKAKLLSTGYTFKIEDSGGRYDEYYSYIFTNPEGVKVAITNGDFLTTKSPQPYPPSIDINCSNIRVGIIGKGDYSGTGTNVTIKKYYQSAEVVAAPSEWVEAKPCDCSDGGDTTQYSYLKLIPDLDAYTDAPVGEIVKYTGQTGKYTRGWDYEKVSSGSTPAVKILSEFNYRSISGSRPFYAYEYTEQVEGYFGFVYGTDKLPLLTFSKTLTAGDKVAYWNSDKTTVTIATISSVTSDGFFIDSNIYISLVDMMDCPISKYTCVGNSSHTCLVKGTTDELIIPEVALMHERFYFNNGSLIGYGQGSNNAFIYRETININIPANTAYIATINNTSYQGPFYPTGKIGNQYIKTLYYDDLDNCYACGYVARSWMLIGDDVFFGSPSGNNFIFNGNKTTIKSVSPNTRFNSGTSPSSSATNVSSGYIEFVNANGDLIYVRQNLLIDAPNTKTTFDVYVPSKGEAFIPTIETAITSNPVAISIGTPSVYWQPIIYPSAPVSSGD